MENFSIERRTEGAFNGRLKSLRKSNIAGKAAIRVCMTVWRAPKGFTQGSAEKFDCFASKTVPFWTPKSNFLDI